MVKSVANKTSSVEVWALVPARSGSKGIKDKNLRRIFGHSILAWSVMAARATLIIDRVFVSTDSPDYMEEAQRYGAETPFRRPAELASDTSTDLDVFLHFLDWALTQGGFLPAAVAHLRPTTPIRDPEVLTRAIAHAVHHLGTVTATRSVHECAESPFKWFMEDDQGCLVTLAGNRMLDSANTARQSFPTVYVPNGYIDVLYPEAVKASGRLHGDTVLPFQTTPVIEVDTELELDLLEKVATIPPALLRESLRFERVKDQ